MKLLTVFVQILLVVNVEGRGRAGGGFRGGGFRGGGSSSRSGGFFSSGSRYAKNTNLLELKHQSNMNTLGKPSKKS